MARHGPPGLSVAKNKSWPLVEVGFDRGETPRWTTSANLERETSVWSDFLRNGACAFELRWRCLCTAAWREGMSFLWRGTCGRWMTGAVVGASHTSLGKASGGTMNPKGVLSNSSLLWLQALSLPINNSLRIEGDSSSVWPSLNDNSFTAHCLDSYTLALFYISKTLPPFLQTKPKSLISPSSPAYGGGLCFCSSSHSHHRGLLQISPPLMEPSPSRFSTEVASDSTSSPLLSS